MIYILKRFRETIERIEDLTKFGLSLWEKLDIHIPKECNKYFYINLVHEEL